VSLHKYQNNAPQAPLSTQLHSRSSRLWRANLAVCDQVLAALSRPLRFCGSLAAAQRECEIFCCSQMLPAPTFPAGNANYPDRDGLLHVGLDACDFNPGAPRPQRNPKLDTESCLDLSLIPCPARLLAMILPRPIGEKRDTDPHHPGLLWKKSPKTQNLELSDGFGTP
jgi:hypothetical protein